MLKKLMLFLLALVLLTAPAFAAEVTIQRGGVSPDPLTISPGEEVTFTDISGLRGHVQVQLQPGVFVFLQDATLKVKFDKLGKYPYEIHHGGLSHFIKGSVIVK